MNTLKLNQEFISIDSITFNQISFGKDRELQSYQYELKINRDFFLENLKPIYDQGFEELRVDDQITGDFDPPYPGAKSYPSLLEFMDIEGSYLYEYLYAYHKFDIFGIALTEDDANAEYIINSLDSIDVISDDIVVKGVAIKR